MANPTSIDRTPAVLVSSVSEQLVTLNSNRMYRLLHDGETAAGAADVNTIYFGTTTGDVDADPGENADKIKLKDGRDITIGPGISRLKFIAAGGAPTFSVIPGRSLPSET